MAEAEARRRCHDACCGTEPQALEPESAAFECNVSRGDVGACWPSRMDPTLGWLGCTQLRPPLPAWSLGYSK